MKKIKADKFSKAIIIMFIVYLVIMLAIFLPYYYRRKHNKIYIVTNNYKIKYEDGSWKSINDTNDYVLKEFNVIDNANEIGKYKLLYSNSIKLLDSDNKRVETDGVLFAYRGTIKFKKYNLDLMRVLNANISDDLFNIIKSKLGINNVIDYAIIDALNISDDIQLYSLTNNNAAVYNPNSLDGISNNDDDKFSVLFMVKNDEIKIIDKLVDDNPDIFEVYGVFDLYEDNSLEMIYSKKPVQTVSNCIKLYNLNKNKEIKDFCK